MAVSGSKQTDMLRSLEFGSADGFEYECEPCLTMGQHKEAQGVCVKCQEYLCQTCEDCHKKTKASRSHQILGRDEFGKLKATKKSSNECTEQCQLHQKELIKFHCPKHSSLGCNDCMTIGHRNCNIDYIPDKCVSIADSKEYKDIMVKLSEKLEEAEDVYKKAEHNSTDITDTNKEIIKKIEEFRAEINNRLDQMQQCILNKVEGKKSNDKKIAKKVIDTCGNIISEMKKLQSSIRANKSNNENGQLYIEIKRAESSMKSVDLTEARNEILKMNQQYSFRRSADLENLLSKEIDFGDLINYTHPEYKQKKNIVDQLIIKDVMRVTTKSDIDTSWITGCAVLSSNKLILVDYCNEKIKVVSVNKKSVLQEKILDSNPYDIAVMSENQCAITMPDKRRIDVITTDDKLSHVRSIEVDGRFYGVDCNQDRLYIVCENLPTVVVLTTQGNVLKKIPLTFLAMYRPNIAVTKDSKIMYISDENSNGVTSITLQGDVLATYRHEDLRGPMRMCLFDDGSLLVCCKDTIYQIKDDLKEGKIVGNDICYPYSICCNRHSDEVYVGCYECELIVLSIKAP